MKVRRLKEEKKTIGFLVLFSGLRRFFALEGSETVCGFWIVRGMYDFENVGFTNAVDGMKYLTCADCEYGPIGFLETETKLHYVSSARVTYG
ncbi:unnamed protein product [Heligmosomoides polygyrus]|uniref:Guanine nucleotide exchange factor MSS4 homolog n=2 Tax=Heligmosomoides polygyrus TaxID=6339 RepID=A0A183GP84_HELPZ|nr:unnamed protein product [Heligmosomoides polygyrus]